MLNRLRKWFTFKRISPMAEQHIHLHIEGLGEVVRLLTRISCQLETMETKMATIDDLNTATDAMTGVMTSNDTRVAALATAVSDAAAANATADAAMQAEIKRLNDLLAAGNTNPVALQNVVDKLTAMSAEGVAQGAAIDDATTALAAAFPPPTP